MCIRDRYLDFEGPRSVSQCRLDCFDNVSPYRYVLYTRPAPAASVNHSQVHCSKHSATSPDLIGRCCRPSTKHEDTRGCQREIRTTRMVFSLPTTNLPTHMETPHRPTQILCCRWQFVFRFRASSYTSKNIALQVWESA